MELYCILSIVDRARGDELREVLTEAGAPFLLSMLGKGTATREILTLLGLDAVEKAIVGTVGGAELTTKLMKAVRRRMYIDVPGNGIMAAIPIKSIGGGKTLAYLSNNAQSDKTAPQMTFDHELIFVVLNEGNVDPVMECARLAGARGGTVLHAKGTGAQRAEQFFGVSLADEREALFIVAKASEKAGIMRAIAGSCGPGTPAGAIAFSLPISEVAGLRMLEDEENEENDSFLERYQRPENTSRR